MIVWKLNELMAERRVTGKQVAEQINSHPNTVYRLRRHNTMPAIDGELLNKLCKALNCTPTDLIEYTPDTEETGKPNLSSSDLSSTDAAQVAAVVGVLTAKEVADTMDSADVAIVASVATKAALSAIQAVLDSESGSEEKCRISQK